MSSDEMTVWGEFIPPRENGKQLLADDLLAGLQALGVVHGLQEKTINEAVFQLNTSRKHLKQVLLAKGTKPKKETPAHLQLAKHLFDHSFGPQESAQSLKNVDHKDVKPFVLVKRGELLARAIPPVQGEVGFTVTGKELPPEKKDIVFLKPGDKCLYNHGKVLAGITGRFTMEQDVFNISDELILENGVNYATGHVVFPGKVHITGIVEDGFRVVAGSDILCDGVLDASEVLCGGDLTIAGGVIGKQPGLVRVEKSANVRFIENAQFEILGDIVCQKGILGSKVFGLGSLTMSEGRVVHSNITLFGGAEILQLGGPAANASITIGLNFVTQRKIERLKELYSDAENRIILAKEQLAKSPSTTRENEIAMLKEQSIKITHEINKLQQTAVNMGAVSLIVLGEVYPGTEVHIGYVQHKVTQSLKSKEFRLANEGMVIEVLDYKPER
jgi:uncharacterized protein (DUF342 family)